MSPSSKLLNWLRSDLISCSGGVEAEWWFFWLSSFTDCLWLILAVSLSLFSAVCHGVRLPWGESLWFCLAHIQSNKSLTGVKRKCTDLRVMMCVLSGLQVVMWRATISVGYFLFEELSSVSQGLFTCQDGQLVLVSLSGSALSNDTLLWKTPTAALSLQPSPNTENRHVVEPVCGLISHR